MSPSLKPKSDTPSSSSSSAFSYSYIYRGPGLEPLWSDWSWNADVIIDSNPFHGQVENAQAGDAQRKDMLPIAAPPTSTPSDVVAVHIDADKWGGYR